MRNLRTEIVSLCATRTIFLVAFAVGTAWNPVLSADKSSSTARPVSLSPYRTFAWAEPSTSQTRLYSQIQAAVANELENRSLNEVAEKPDLLVVLKTRAGSGGSGLPSNSRPETQLDTEQKSPRGLDTYGEGSLEIILKDAKTDAVVWQNMTLGMLRVSDDPVKDKKRIEKVVKKAMSSFPRER